MANTVSFKDNVIMLSALDSDWSLADMSAYGLSKDTGVRIKGIKFFPGAANDILVIEYLTDAGGLLCKLKSVDGEPRIDDCFPDSPVHPILDYSDCTISSGGAVSIVLR